MVKLFYGQIKTCAEELNVEERLKSFINFVSTQSDVRTRIELLWQQSNCQCSIGDCPVVDGIVSTIWTPAVY